jgi:hypothetical protein
MKNIYKKGLGIIAIILALTSCSPDEPIHSTITNYPVIAVAGDGLMFAPQGEPFTDPGATATIDGNEVPVDTSYHGMFSGTNYDGTLGTNVPDLYTATYSAMNEDGFAGTETRLVFVGRTGDLVNSIEGLYRSTVLRNGAGGAAYTDMEYVMIWKNEDGTYEISDAIGGYYDIGRAYGLTYINPGGIIVANDIPSNNFDFPGTQTNLTFGGESEITGMEVHPETHSIDMVTVWQADASTTYTFEIHLEQVQF